MRLSSSAFLLLVLTPAVSFTQQKSDALPVSVGAFEWKSERRSFTGSAETAVAVPQMIPENRNFQRAARAQQTPGAQDPNDQTIDGRSSAIEKNVQESRKRKAEPVNGFAYTVKIRNDGSTLVEVVFVEFRFVEKARPSNVVRRQFVCVANITPGEKKELSVFSTAGPSDVISTDSLSDRNAKLFTEIAFVNRTEDSKGVIVQRSDWKFAEVRNGLLSATSTPWGMESCRPI